MERGIKNDELSAVSYSRELGTSRSRGNAIWTYSHIVEVLQDDDVVHKISLNQRVPYNHNY